MFRRYPFVFVFLVTALLICGAYYLHIPFNLRADTEADYLDSLRTFRVQVIEPPVQKPTGWLLTVRLLSMHDKDSVRRLSQQALLTLRTDSLHTAVPAMGDILLARMRIAQPHAVFKGDFDYGNYLRLQHKVGIGFVQPQHWQRIGHAPVRSLRACAATVQQRLLQRLAQTGLHGRALAFIAAVTIGERDALDSDLRRSFAAAGAAHVLAVSGLHTGIIYLVIVSLLTCFGYFRPLYEQRTRRIVLSLTVILTMWVYAFITGLSPSVMRAVLMLTVVQVGWMIRRTGISLNTLAAAACICLWVDPLSLFSVSFQLSFAAVLGILLFVPHMNAMWKANNRIVQWIRDLLTVSVAATIGTLPVTLYYFGQVSRIFLLANIVVLPATYVLVVLGALTLLLAPTAVGTWLAIALQYLSDYTCRYVQWIEHLPHATLQLSVTPWMVVFLVATVVFCYLRIRRRSLAWYAPAAAAIGLFCVLHIYDMRQSMSDHAFAVRGKILYCKQGGRTDQYPLDSPYTFFRYDGCDYVYAPYLSDRKQHCLERFCADKAITILTARDAR